MSFVKSTFYTLYKDYGGKANFIKIGKADIDLDTGQRQRKRIVTEIKVIYAPNQRKIFNVNWANNDQTKAQFLTLDLIEVEPDDYIVYKGSRYTNLEVERHLDGLFITGVHTSGSESFNSVSVAGVDEVLINEISSG